MLASGFGFPVPTNPNRASTLMESVDEIAQKLRTLEARTASRIKNLDAGMQPLAAMNVIARSMAARRSDIVELVNYAKTVTYQLTLGAAASEEDQKSGKQVKKTIGKLENETFLNQVFGWVHRLQRAVTAELKSSHAAPAYRSVSKEQREKVQPITILKAPPVERSLAEQTSQCIWEQEEKPMLRRLP